MSHKKVNKIVMLWVALCVTQTSVANSSPTNLVHETQKFSVETGATRVIFTPNSQGSTLTVTNPQTYPILVQSEVLQADKETKSSFVVTPPLFRLDGEQSNRIRIINTEKLGPDDRESLYWLCITGIPPEIDSDWVTEDEKSKQLDSARLLTQMRIKSCIKLIVRPKSIANKTALDVASSIEWIKEGERLKIHNPTPYIFNFKDISINNKKVSLPDSGYILPYSDATVSVKAVGDSTVSWHLITDFGGESRKFESKIKG
ncbi:fimbria/pilus periplasmic chaperone [Providencia rettgeri]